MKLYIVSNSKSGTDTGEGLYYLVSEEGELIDKWLSSNKYFAMTDLYTRNPRNQEYCKEKFGDDVEVLYLGQDGMTNEKLKTLNKKFINS